MLKRQPAEANKRQQTKSRWHNPDWTPKFSLLDDDAYRAASEKLNELRGQLADVNREVNALTSATSLTPGERRAAEAEAAIAGGTAVIAAPPAAMIAEKQHLRSVLENAVAIQSQRVEQAKQGAAQRIVDEQGLFEAYQTLLQRQYAALTELAEAQNDCRNFQRMLADSLGNSYVPSAEFYPMIADRLDAWRADAEQCGYDVAGDNK
jgi:hypothetical protein